MGFFSIEGLTTLAMLILLQAVLGFDNVLYISIESKRAPEDQQSWVRRMGIILAIVLRIVLLLVIMLVIDKIQAPLFSIAENNFLSGEFTLHSLITLFGGGFILYTAVKEVLHLLAIEHIEHGVGDKGQKSTWAVIFWIVLMNLVFSFDSILSAIALTNQFERPPAFWLMAVAVLISGVMMLYLADTVSEFLKKNRMYEVLGLFVLFIVGVMLLGEGGHLAHLHLFTYVVEPMAKSTFYFTLAVLVAINIIQSRYRKKLMAQRGRELKGSPA